MKKTLEGAPLIFDHDYHIHVPEKPKRLYVLLHGYLLDGKFMMDKLLNSLPEDGLVVSPNGPFPVPVKKNNQFAPRYAWYFFDPEKKIYYINYDPAAYFMKSFLQRIWPLELPITLIGYSQGGYLAPKLAEIIPMVDTVIGLACTYRNAKFKFRSEVTIHQINSENDSIVTFETAQREFQELERRGNTGEFITLKEAGHKLDEYYIASLESLLKY
jgi:predicted esterase